MHCTSTNIMHFTDGNNNELNLRTYPSSQEIKESE